MMITPPKFTDDKTIAVLAPSSITTNDRIKKTETYFKNNKLKSFIHSQTYFEYNQSAGTNAQKRKAFDDVFSRHDIGMIIAAGGGNRALHLLDTLDFKMHVGAPKIFMGYSDCTALLNAFAAFGMVTFHGPMPSRIEHPNFNEEFSYALDIVRGNERTYPLEQSSIFQKGKAHGTLLGGNLSVFLKLIGTKYEPDLNGAILCLEDVNDELSWFDRDLWHLRQMGILNKISGLILGSFSKGDSGRPYGFTFEDIIQEHTNDLDIPIITNAPFGHADKLYAFPVGVTGYLDASGTIPKLTFDSPVSDD